MSTVDVIYDVTMQEAGRFQEFKLTAHTFNSMPGN